MSDVDTATPRVARPNAAATAAAMAAVAVLVVSFARWGPDWPAQEFRAELARTSAFLLWNDNWYAGHALPGYSVLYPVLAHDLGAGGTAVFASVLAAAVAPRLLPSATTRARRRLFVAAVVLTLSAALVIGQVPFLLGLAFAVCAVVALRHVSGRVGWIAAAALALASSLASPLAGALLLLVAGGLTAVHGWRRTAALGTAVGGTVVALTVGGAGGRMPFPWTTITCTFIFCGVLWLVVGHEPSPMRAFASRFVPLYAVAAAACFAVPNPVGGNIARLSQVMALPAAAALISRRTTGRLVGTLTALVLAVVWTAQPAESSLFGASRQPSRTEAYYTGLLTFLSTQPAGGRIEIPFTHDHWEAAYVAPHYALARGWERQTDLAENEVLYDPLTPAAYETWLHDNAVSLVALPDVPLDTGGRAEAAILAHPPAYLHLVWQDAHWHVWSVDGSPPLATGAGSVVSIGTQNVMLRVSRPGTTVVRIHASRLWQVTSGDACVGATPGGWLTVTAQRPGLVVLETRLDGLVGRSQDPACEGLVP